MTTGELKKNIQKKIENIEDITILKEVNSILDIVSSGQVDYNKFPEELKQSIEEGLAQLNDGKRLTYDEVKKRNKRWFMK